jgi:hypothetical protein
MWFSKWGSFKRFSFTFSKFFIKVKLKHRSQEHYFILDSIIFMKLWSKYGIVLISKNLKFDKNWIQKTTCNQQWFYCILFVLKSNFYLVIEMSIPILWIPQDSTSAELKFKHFMIIFINERTKSLMKSWCFC